MFAIDQFDIAVVAVSCIVAVSIFCNKEHDKTEFRFANVFHLYVRSANVKKKKRIMSSFGKCQI